MSTPQTTVLAIAPAHREAWLEMWKAYCAFYEVDLPERVTRRTWDRLVAADGGMDGLIALNAATGEALGIANYIVHPYTWSEYPACYLEDLFVQPSARGTGVGAALIDRLIAACKENRWARLYWLTRETNVTARRLYDRFVQRDDFVRYDLPIAFPSERRTPGGLSERLLQIARECADLPKME